MENAALINEARPNGKTYYSISLAMLGAIMFGVDCANFGQTQGFTGFLKEFCEGTWDKNYSCKLHDGVLNNPDYQNIFCMLSNVLLVLGATAGAVLLAPIVAGGAGRRACISLGAFVTFVGTAISAFLSFGNSYIFWISRIVTGFGVGVCCYALPMYNSEMATAKIRGSTGSLFQLFTVIGQFFATMVMLKIHNWRLGMLFPGIFGFIVSIAIWFAPESPRWTMRTKGFEAAVAILRQVRMGDVTAEAQEIQAAIDAEANEQKISMAAACGDANLRKRITIASYLQTAQQATGVNAFLGYANILFPKLGIKNVFVFNVLWNGVMVIGVIFGILMIDSSRGGRRPQLLGATILMGPSLVVAGAFLQTGSSNIVVAVMVCLFALGFQSGWGMIPWVYPSEIFSNKEREVAMGFAVGFQYFMNAVIYLVSPLMMTWSGPGTMYIFGALNITNFVFVSTCIKETKGVPLEKVPELFGKVDRSAKAATIA